MLARWRPAALVIVIVICGFVWTTLRAGLVLQEELPRELEGRDIDIVGYVADIPQTPDYGVRFLFDVHDAHAEGRSVNIPQRLLLSSAFQELAPRAGEQWRLRVRL